MNFNLNFNFFFDVLGIAMAVLWIVLVIKEMFSAFKIHAGLYGKGDSMVELTVEEYRKLLRDRMWHMFTVAILALCYIAYKFDI